MWLHALRRLAVLIALCAFAQAPARAEQEPPVVVEGILMIGEFFGPPNYGEDPQTDTIERSFVLQLPAPLPTQMARKGLDGVELGEDADREFFVQLVVFGESLGRAEALIGKKVRVSGAAFQATTGHHRTGTLVRVTSIVAIESWNW
jgi:hypothetical protein